jgi:hypothetical protein
MLEGGDKSRDKVVKNVKRMRVEYLKKPFYKLAVR